MPIFEKTDFSNAVYHVITSTKVKAKMSQLLKRRPSNERINVSRRVRTKVTDSSLECAHQS